MTTSSERPDVRAAIRRAYGLGDDWTVRFTAESRRAAEMARQYRDAGWEARVLALPTPDTGPCGPCLRDARVVVTRRRAAGDAGDPAPDRPYD